MNLSLLSAVTVLQASAVMSNAIGLRSSATVVQLIRSVVTPVDSELGCCKSNSALYFKSIEVGRG